MTQIDDEREYKVVVNEEDQYSIVPSHIANPAGWQDVGRTGTAEECEQYVDDVWADMRPRSLRNRMPETH
jgi:MbtH protein